MWQRHPFRSADDVARRKRETFSWKKVTIGRAIATGWKQLVERITGFIPPPTESLPSVYDENSTIFPRLISPTEITCCCCRLSPFYRLLSCSSSSKALYKEEGTTAPSSGQTWLAKNQSQTRGRARGERGERLVPSSLLTISCETLKREMSRRVTMTAEAVQQNQYDTCTSLLLYEKPRAGKRNVWCHHNPPAQPHICKRTRASTANQR